MVKLVMSLILSILLISPAICLETEADGYSIDNIHEKYDKFSKMRTSGIVLSVLGATSLVTGIVLFSTQASRPAGPMTDQEMNAQIVGMVGGFVLIGIGIPLTITGGVLGIIGANKCKEYKAKLHVSGGYNNNKYYARIEFNY
jgi:hypothetical protein